MGLRGREAGRGAAHAPDGRAMSRALGPPIFSTPPRPPAPRARSLACISSDYDRKAASPAPVEIVHARPGVESTDASARPPAPGPPRQRAGASTRAGRPGLLADADLSEACDLG